VSSPAGTPVATVGVVGIGSIGAGVTKALLRGGYEVVGFDVRAGAVEAAGARAAASLTELAEAADLVLVAVYDDEQVRDVLSGSDSLLGSSSRPRAIFILSTVTLDTIRWAAGEGAAHGVAVLDCGVSGGRTLRDHGRIAVMIGGDEATVEWARPALETFGVPTVHMGLLGTGMSAKIARNMITYGGWFVAVEAARIAEAGGVDVEKLIQICEAADESTGGPIGILRRGIRPGAPRDDEDRVDRERLMGFVHKDLGAAFELGAELGVESSGARVVEREFPKLVGVDGDEP
jgi:3-hydroxyisobutyrate dehydrogenase-like beta-hydroxyacid dehydrogenase